MVDLDELEQPTDTLTSMMSGNRTQRDPILIYSFELSIVFVKTFKTMITVAKDLCKCNSD